MLPITELENDILAAVNAGNRLIIRAPTGSGKSTQVPQFLLDHAHLPGKILVLQPRRIAARMLACRVAEERSVIPGGDIGFQTRFESAHSEHTRVLFITEGILTRMLLGNPELRDISAIIFDEFHERNLSSDVGLSLAFNLQNRYRPDLKIIVMSATVDIAPLQKFLPNVSIINSGGRLFPIDIRYVPSAQGIPVWDRAAHAVNQLVSECPSGDILVFMPGVYEIRRTAEAIERAIRNESVSVLQLYGDLPANRQNQVMEPASLRKIIVATNIAETSLTITGVRHVVDAGLARVNRFDPARGFNTLFTESISRDSADQRAGRAGREAPGICIRLWSAAKHTELPLHSTPEIHRVDLAETVLSISQLGYASPGEFGWFEPPAPVAIEHAQTTLSLLGATGNTGTLTPLGKELSRFPMHPRLARLILEAGRRNCVHLATFCAAILSERTVLAGKPDYPEEAYNHELVSDFYGQYCLIEKLHTARFDESLCNRYAVNASAAKNILRTQDHFLDICKKSGMNLQDGAGAPASLARCILLAYPDHLAVRKDKGTFICKLRGGRKGFLSETSIARSVPFLVATDISEKKDARHEIKTTLSLATEIREEWLLEHFEASWRTEIICEWNSLTSSVEEISKTICCDVILYETTQTAASERASALLAETIIAKKLPLPNWDQPVAEYISRVQWAARLFPQEHLPCFTDDDRALIIHELCTGETQLKNAGTKPLLPFVQSLLTDKQRFFVEEMAPASIFLPTGKKLRLLYEAGNPPRVRARIQDLYGMQTTPTIASGRAPVLIEVLAPNNRPVQITHDLANFWIAHYPELKKTLSRRYPRHEWR